MSDELAVVEPSADGADGVVLRVRGEVDMSNADGVGDRVAAMVRGNSGAVLDLSAVEFLDSQGLRMLYQLSRRLGDAGTSLTLLAPRDTVAGEALRLAALDRDLDVRDTLGA